ncbi:MAG TPA: type III pantothenate kinase [Phototrophicaceae bacterium]|jgi:type III pantothenate kinase|nr:type III pantothenate kinase [Phototrophicaceae bacterium]
MLLAIDIGNTNIKFGLWDDQRQLWQAMWRVRTQQQTSAVEYGILLRECAANDQILLNDVTNVIVSSVVPALTPILLEMVWKQFRIKAYLVTPHSPTGLQIALDFPEQVGTDRLLNAVAAFALVHGAVIAVDLGTATKFDVVTAEGIYIGGAIAPGIAVSGDSLATRIAQLPRVELTSNPSIIGTSTVDAMQSGLVWGMVSIVEGMLTRLKSALNDPYVRVIAAGGLAPVVQPHLNQIDSYIPTLTLDGLRVIHTLQNNLNNKSV